MNNSSIENKMDPAGGKKTDVALIIVIVIIVIFFALPAVFFAVFYFRFIKPALEDGISSVSHSSSGYTVDAKVVGSFKNVYLNSYMGDAIDLNDCKAIELYTNVEAEQRYDFCSTGNMSVAVDFVSDGIDIKIRGTEGGVEYVFDPSFSKYYSLKRYDDAEMMSGDFASYRLTCGTSCIDEDTTENVEGDESDSEDSIDDSLEENTENINI